MAEQIDRLVTVWDARFDRLEEKLNKAVRATHGAAAKMEKRLDAVNDNVAAKFKRNLGREFSAGLEEIGGRAGRAGALLDGFGAAGLAAAGVLGALTIAAGKAREAMAFGDELQTASEKLQISAEAMQELQFAADETDVPVEKLRENLEKLNGTIGAFKTGIGGKKVASAFAALGISKEDLKDVSNATDLLPILADRLGQVRDTASQVQIARKLGIEDLLPLLRQGSDGLAEMRQRAHELGLVLSNETVRSLAEADRQMELAGQQINTSLRAAFAGLAVDIAAATTRLAEFLVWLRKSDSAWAVFARAAQDALVNNPFFNPVGFARSTAGKFNPQRGTAVDNRRVTTTGIQAALGVKPSGGFDLQDVSTDKGSKAKAKRDSTLERSAQVADAQLGVERDLLNAWRELVVGAGQRADIAKLLLDLEGEEFRSRVDRQIAEIQADEGLTDAKKLQLAAALESVKREQGKVDDLRREQIDRELTEQKAKDALSVRQSEVEAQEEVLRLAESLARTAGQRRDLELKLLEVSDQRLQAEYEAVVASKTASEADKQIARNKLATLQATRGGREQQVLNNTRGPLEDYFASLPQTADEVNEAFQRMEAQGISQLIDGLSAAAVGAANLGDVFRQTIQQMAIDANRILLQSLLSGGTSGGGFAGFFAGLFKRGGVPGSGIDISGLAGLYAGGTDSARGGLSLIGEHGPELLNIPRGAQVIPNDILRSLARQRAARTSNSQTWAPVLNVTVMGGGSPADNRRTGAQVGAAAAREMATYRRKGF